MDRFFRNKPLVVTVILVVIILAILIFTTGQTDISGGQTVAGGVFVPLQRLLYSMTEGISSGLQKTLDSSGMEKENRELKEEVAGLKSEFADYSELKRENERLAKLLEYTGNHPDFKYKTAGIVAKNPGIWFDSFTINLGTNDGVAVDMPVVTPDGLVGRVEEAGMNWAKVMTLIDGRSGVSTIIDRTREVGSVRGRMESDPGNPLLDMELLPMDTDIQVGDSVLTSGIGGIYPKGLAVGQVVSVGPQANRKKVEVKTAVHFRNLEEVLVIVSAADGGAGN